MSLESSQPPSLDHFLLFRAPSPSNVSGECQSALWERWARPWGFLLCKDHALRCLRIVTVHNKVRNSRLLTPKLMFSPCLQQVHGRCGEHVQEVVLSLKAQQALLEGPRWSWALGNVEAGLSAELLPTGQMAPLVSITCHPSQTRWFICLLHLAYQNCCDFWVGESLFSRVVLNASSPLSKIISSLAAGATPLGKIRKMAVFAVRSPPFWPLPALPGSVQCSSFPPTPATVYQALAPPVQPLPLTHHISNVLQTKTEFTATLETEPAGRWS